MADAVVRFRCRCGQRCRVRNAQPDTVIRCPKCQRPIRLTRADLQAAAAGVAFEPLQPAAQAAADELQEALPLAGDELRMAPSDAAHGTLGGVEHTEESLAAGLLQTHTPSNWPANPDVHAHEEPGAAVCRRSFVDDLLQTLILGGDRQNLFVLLCTAGALAAMTLVQLCLGMVFGLFAYPLTLILGVLILMFMVHYLWSTMTRTAMGEDDIPIVEPTWSLWDDGLVPLVELALITAFCFVPAWVTQAWMANTPDRVLIVYGLLLLGSMLWPVAVMSVAIGDSLAMLRPDLLVRCIIGIGPVYVLAWGLVWGAVVLWNVTWTHIDSVNLPIPVLGAMLVTFAAAFAALYIGYVIFRTLGLLYRHFHQRFPWRFD